MSRDCTVARAWGQTSSPSLPDRAEFNPREAECRRHVCEASRAASSQPVFNACVSSFFAMEAVGLVASVIAIVQLTEACLKLSSKLTGPSSYKPERLQSLSTTLYNFNGTIKNLQTHLEIHEDDQARLDGMTPGSEI